MRQDYGRRRRPVGRDENASLDQNRLRRLQECPADSAAGGGRPLMFCAMAHRVYPIVAELLGFAQPFADMYAFEWVCMLFLSCRAGAPAAVLARVLPCRRVSACVVFAETSRHPFRSPRDGGPDK